MVKELLVRLYAAACTPTTDEIRKLCGTWPRRGLPATTVVTITGRIERWHGYSLLHALSASQRARVVTSRS